MTTPPPPPAALVEAMASPIAHDVNRDGEYFMTDTEAQRVANACLDAAHAAGFVLIPRAELEEAAEAVWRLASLSDESDEHPGPNMKLAERLMDKLG